jgi:phosphoribosylamine--glycine ligase
MGAYSPAPVVDEVVYQRIMDQVITPTIRGMAAEGNDYTGFLYAGLMITADGQPRVIEYNCRFGDPETQPIMLRLQSDLVSLCDSALAGTLDQASAQWDPRCAIGVVLAAGGYPGSYAKGTPIQGLDAPQPDNIKVFHAGTAHQDSQVVTSGGRVLCVTALGEDIAAAQQACYTAAEKISWDGMTLRRDIGWRAIARYSEDR